MTNPAVIGEFDLEEFEALVAEFGQSVAWAKSVLCPCGSTRSGGASALCVGCGGLGRVWLTPKSYTLLLTAFAQQREFAQFTEAEKGDSILTVPETYLNKGTTPYTRTAIDLYDQGGEYDRVTQSAAALRFQQQCVRGSDERLRHSTIVAIQEVASVGTSALVYYTRGPDYTWTSGRTLTWQSGHGPASGASYSIAYTARPEWYVFRDLVMQRPHQGGLRLPRKIHLRAADVFWRGHGGYP